MGQMKINTMLFLGVLLLVSYSRTAADVNTEKIADSINDFSIKFHKELIKDKDNVFSSGFSLTTVLNMLLTGAKTDTAKELRNVLGYESAALTDAQAQDAYHGVLDTLRKKHNGTDISVANSMWIQKGFNVLSQYKTTVREKYYAEENEVNFGTEAATDEINNWVSKETKGKIPKLFDEPLSSDTRLVLANALYFKGLWKNKFRKELTEDYPFIFNKSTENQIIKMMNIIHRFQFTESKDLSAQLLEIPYEGDDVSMIFVLPMTVDGLSPLEQQLTLQNLNKAMKLMTNEKVHVKIPKFKSSSVLPLSTILQSMGVKKAFTPGVADFSGINGQRDLYVSTAIQKAIIELNEEGTEAAAATGIGMQRSTAIKPDSKEYFFTADHPFLYFIKHKPTNVFLFMGRMGKPQ